MESTTVTIVESTSEAATMTTITESASHATVKAAAFEAATTEAATGKAAAHTASVATSAAAAPATRQRHCWRDQANGRNRQHCDNHFAQHHHSPSEIPLPIPTLPAGGDRFGKSLSVFDEPIAQVFASDARLNLKSESESQLPRLHYCRCNLRHKGTITEIKVHGVLTRHYTLM
jgi:hypothetical protein